MSFNTNEPIRVIGGRDAVRKNASVLSSFGKKCLIVTGRASARKSGALDDVTSSLKECGVEYEIFDKITENPLTSTCFEAGQRAREIGAEFIVGIGGGSPLDAAKAVAVFASNRQMSSPDLIYSEPVTNKPLPVVLVGTSAGTGSEVTGVSVLTNTLGKKKSVKGENYYAAVALADSKYTFSLPFDVTVSTALDALCHAVESHISKKATEKSRVYSENAIKLVWSELVTLYETGQLPDKDARERLYDASLFAGQAINLTGTCFPHSVGYFLTEKHSVPHGRACAVFLPEYIKRGLENNPEPTEIVLKMMNADFDFVHKVISTLADVRINPDLQELENYLPNWERVANFDNTPGGFDKNQAKQLIISLFSNKR